MKIDNDQLRRTLARLPEIIGDTTNAGTAWYKGEIGELDALAEIIGLKRGGYTLVDDWRAANPKRLAAWKNQRESDELLRIRVRTRIVELLGA